MALFLVKNYCKNVKTTVASWGGPDCNVNDYMIADVMNDGPCCLKITVMCYSGPPVAANVIASVKCKRSAAAKDWPSSMWLILPAIFLEGTLFQHLRSKSEDFKKTFCEEVASNYHIPTEKRQSCLDNSVF